MSSKSGLDNGFIIDGSSLFMRNHPQVSRFPANAYQPYTTFHITVSKRPNLTLQFGLRQVVWPGTCIVKQLHIKQHPPFCLVSNLYKVQKVDVYILYLIKFYTVKPCATRSSCIIVAIRFISG